MSDLYPSEQGYTLWGSSGIRPDDIGQGAIGDCWFISAAAAVAEDYKRIERLFLNTEMSDDVGIYALNVYALGLPVTITIDDFIPYLEYYGPPFVTAGPDKSIWGSIVEKGIAKM